MRAGQLKDIITIEHLVVTSDDEYGYDNASGRLFSVRAEARNDRGQRIADNGELFHAYDVTFRVWEYLRKHIRESDKIHWEGRRYYIDSIDHDRSTKSLIIKAVRDHG